VDISKRPHEQIATDSTTNASTHYWDSTTMNTKQQQQQHHQQKRPNTRRKQRQTISRRRSKQQLQPRPRRIHSGFYSTNNTPGRNNDRETCHRGMASSILEEKWRWASRIAKQSPDRRSRTIIAWDPATNHKRQAT